MMVMTAKVNKKKILAIAAGVIGIIAALIFLLGKKDDTVSTAATSAGTNDERVKFLTDSGWEVNTTPVESGQVRIPDGNQELFRRYNALQKNQGYDLMPYGGKLVQRYVYQIKNYPDASEPVYATLLIHKNQIIGGDVTDTSAKGKIQGFQKGAAPVNPTEPVPSAESTQPSE